MINIITKSSLFTLLSAILVLITAGSCNNLSKEKTNLNEEKTNLIEEITSLSEEITSETAGFNGSFEFVESGLPVNFQMYTPKTVKEADFKIIIDTEQFKEGKQSLKFDVKECSQKGGRLSPGFSTEMDAKPETIYKVSFWYINKGCEFNAEIGAVSAKTAEPAHTVLRSAIANNSWEFIEYDYWVSIDYSTLRFQLNVLQPGKFWIDDLKIELMELPEPPLDDLL